MSRFYVCKKKIILDKKFLRKCKYVARNMLNIPQNDCSTTGKIATVILENPSKVDKENSDQTINQVLEYMYVFQYLRGYVLNLITVYAVDSSLVDRKLWYNLYKGGEIGNSKKNLWDFILKYNFVLVNEESAEIRLYLNVLYTARRMK